MAVSSGGRRACGQRLPEKETVVWRGFQRAVLIPFQASFLQLAVKKDGELNYWMASQVLRLPLAPFGLFLRELFC